MRLIFAFTLAIASAQPIVLNTSTILDGKGGVLKDRQIVIEGSKITAVQAGKRTAAYDLRGLTVMPGWIDAHVHLNWHFDADHKLVNRGDAAHAAENARITLEGGFTTVQSLGAQVDLEVRDKVAQGLLPGPRILTSVRQINERSGTPDAIRELVRKTKADGADLIKLFATTGMSAGGNQSMSDE